MGGTIVPRIWSTAVAGENANPLTPARSGCQPTSRSASRRQICGLSRISTIAMGQLWDIVHGRPIPLTRENDNAMDDHPVVAPDGERIAVSTLLQDDIWELRVLHKGVDLRRPRSRGRARLSRFRLIGPGLATMCSAGFGTGPV